MSFNIKRHIDTRVIFRCVECFRRFDGTQVAWSRPKVRLRLPKSCALSWNGWLMPAALLALHVLLCVSWINKHTLG